jgi:ferrochelatase
MPHNSSIIDSEEVLGVLINNLGTPDSYQVQDVRNFLKEFLWDPRVVKLPRFIWWFVLNLIILNTRPERSAKAYRKIWTADGSPLLSISSKLTDLIQYRLQESGAEILVELGMRYGIPVQPRHLWKMKLIGCSRIPGVRILRLLNITFLNRSTSVH